jgi:acyl-[acyl-carrier-protein]-phospholipid O-acyltransferase/long-chain-fatty-acid--[acyl-carrier-protein] ligase
MVASVLRLLSRLLFRVEVRGKANAPSHGKLLVIANHESFLDGCCSACSCLSVRPL